MSKAFTVRIEGNDYERLERLAKETGRSRGDVLRRLFSTVSEKDAKRILGESPKQPQMKQNN